MASLIDRVRYSLDNLWPQDACHALIFVRSEGHLLLAKKVMEEGTGHGRLNGYGIKIKFGERVIDAAVRGLSEMTGLEIPQAQFRHAADIDSRVYETADDDFEDYHHIARLYIFIADIPKRVSVPGIPEMEDPRWYAEDALPWPEMFPDDEHWLRRALAASGYYGRVLKFVYRDHSLMDSAPSIYEQTPRDIYEAPVPDPNDPRFAIAA